MKITSMELKFPNGFFWGAATSAHQVEGGNLNDWTEWEKKNALRLASLAQGKQWPEYILQRQPNPLQPKNYISGKACDHYNLYGQDFDIAKELGHNAHRFSIEWSRIEPQEGKFNEKEIEHYKKVIQALRQGGIEPFVTILHWTVPLWFSKKGGWLDKNAFKYFERYCAKLAENYGKEVRFWITLNEPIIYTSHSYLRGIWPPQKKNIFKMFRAVDHLAQAHRLAYRSLHSADRDCQVGIAKNDVYYKNHVSAHYFDDSYLINKVREQQDFTAVNFYVRFGLFRKKRLPASDLGWQICPECLYHILKRLVKYGKPIYITENGLADARDEKRTEFIKEHLFWTHKAIQEGVDVRGYFHWSLLDNFEWDKGFWPRFGLVEVDYKTMERKIRPSAREYAKIAKSNSLNL